MSPRARRSNGISTDPGSEAVERCETVEELLADLETLMDAGLVVEIRELGQQSRYGLSAAAHDHASRPTAVSDSYPVPDWPEPCPACGAREGFDGADAACDAT